MQIHLEIGKPQVQKLEFEEQIKEEFLPDNVEKLDDLKTIDEKPKYSTHKSEKMSELISFAKVESHKRHDKVIFNIPIQLEEPSVEITEIHSDDETEIAKQGETSYHIYHHIIYFYEKKPFDFCFSINTLNIQH